MLKNLLIVCIFLFASPKLLATSSATGPHIKVSLLAQSQTITAGETHWLGVLLSPDEEWHTYWRNPGDSGEAPSITWQSNADIEFGDIQWPIPEQIPVAHLVNYGYNGDTLLMVPIIVKDENKQTIDISADLSWLVCKEDCIPGWATLKISLGLGQTSVPSEAKALFEQTRTRLPKAKMLIGQYEINEQSLAIASQVPYLSNWQLLPFRSDIIQHNEVQTWTYTKQNQANTLLQRSDYFTPSDDPIHFLLTDGETGYYFLANPNEIVQQTSEPLWLLLLFAFIGGLILNIMPCVLPVLSLKALALAGHNHEEKPRSHWGYPLGIFVSFWLFAVLILSLKAAGNAIGWGFHLQQPLVIAGLAFLFVFIALMLWDLTPSGARLAGIGQQLTQGTGFGSQFFTGVLAVIVASPCTAPFMASALGVAMVSPAIETLLIFSALAFGFALPMSLLSISPKFASLLPKPGNWMVTFKHFLAFPMLATVIWLVWVFLGQTGSLGQLWLLSGLLFFALFIWLASNVGKPQVYLCFIMALAVAGYTSIKGAEQVTSAQADQSNLNFSTSQLAQLRNDNQVVFVNMTADWCITCKVNEQVAFQDPAFESLIAQENVHYMVGDWTNKNAEILEFLTQYQRSGVPLYVVYAGNSSEQVLPQVLTTDIVTNAIKQAQKELNHALSL